MAPGPPGSATGYVTGTWQLLFDGNGRGRQEKEVWEEKGGYGREGEWDLPQKAVLDLPSVAGYLSACDAMLSSLFVHSCSVE